MKWCRRVGIALAALLLAAGYLLFHFIRVGIPSPLVDHLEDSLREQGWEMRFDRARWRPGRGLVIEGLHLQAERGRLLPLVQAGELALDLGSGLSLRAAGIKDARLQLPTLSMEAEGLQARLERDGNDLRIRLQGRLLGCPADLRGRIRHPERLQIASDGEFDPEPWKRLVEDLTRILDSIPEGDRPVLQARFDADARDLEHASASLTLSGPALPLPLGSLDSPVLSLTFAPDAHTARARLSAGLWKSPRHAMHQVLLESSLERDADGLRLARWSLESGAVSWEDLHLPSLSLGGETRRSDDGLTSHLVLTLPGADHEDLSLGAAQLVATLTHQGVRTDTLEGRWKLQATDLDTPWGRVPEVRLHGELGPRFGERFGDRPITVGGTFAGISGEHLETGAIRLRARWRAPLLSLDRFVAALHGGSIDMEASLDTTTREVQLHRVSTDFPIHRIAHLLPEASRRWLDRYRFATPPRIRLSGGAILPERSRSEGERGRRLRTSLRLAGTIEAGEGSYRTVPFASATTSLTLTNQLWHLPDLRIRRSEGDVRFDLRSDQATRDFRWDFEGTVDPPALVPLLSPTQREALALFEFAKPMKARGTARGRWKSPERIHFDTHLILTDFLFRSVEHDSFRARILYTNRVADITGPALQGPHGDFQADHVRVDADKRRVVIDRGLSTLDPVMAGRMIGPAMEERFGPYRFERPPRITLDGMIPFDGRTGADARFEVRGGPFAWRRLRSPRLVGRILWKERGVRLTNVVARFHGGRLAGSLDLQPGREGRTPFSLEAEVEDADLHSLLDDVSTRKQQPTGRLDGRIRIHSGWTDENRSWEGDGWASLKEGVLWDAPLFGIVSSTLNTFSPGLGNSRAISGEGNFRMAEGALSTTNLTLLLDSSTRLLYQGSIDYSGALDARVEARILRDAPLLGRELSIMLLPFSKLSVCRVGGTLEDPQIEPVYILPKVLYTMFGPILRPDRTPPAPSPED